MILSIIIINVPEPTGYIKYLYLIPIKNVIFLVFYTVANFFYT